MVLISHRGNINGINKDKENSYDYLLKALIKGYNVETDIWLIDDKWYLGHDEPKYEIKIYDFSDYLDITWFHCKNIEAFEKISKYPNIIYFWHQNDDYTLTSNGLIWTFPGKKLTERSICVLPENYNYTNDELKICYGICSDNIKNYKLHIN